MKRAALLLIVGLVLPLVVWLVTGWSGVRRAQGAIEASAIEGQKESERTIAARLGARLDALRESESRRPYFHYQNLFHDPAAVDNGASVLPSPLAAAPSDAVVWSYFSVDPSGKLTVPTVNEDVPELNDADGAAGHRALETLRPAARALCAAASGEKESAPTLVAQNDDVPQQQVIKADVYAQNANANQIYSNLKQQKKAGPSLGANGDVTITVGPLRWALIALDPRDTRLVAVRAVSTPAGTTTQGFVVDVARALEEIAPEATVIVDHDGATRDDGDVPLPVLGGVLRVQTPPKSEASIAAERSAIRTEFLVRFVPVALLALVCGALVLVVVDRTERLARTRSRFAASAAHELRTPLAGLRLYGEMLADDLGDPAQTKQYAQRVADEAARLGRIVGNVLGFTQLERGSLRVRTERGDVSAWLREEVERLRPTMEALGATLTLDAPEGIEARFDRDALGRIVQNLIDNAEKYTRTAKDRTIVVTLRRADRCAEIVVDDRGPGVPQPLRRSLFSPFARDESKDAPAGLGLGLAMSRALARAQRGDLRCEDVSKGARFTVTLPTDAA